MADQAHGTTPRRLRCPAHAVIACLQALADQIAAELAQISDLERKVESSQRKVRLKAFVLRTS